jgi:hypothetical protein
MRACRVARLEHTAQCVILAGSLRVPLRRETLLQQLDLQKPLRFAQTVKKLERLGRVHWSHARLGPIGGSSVCQTKQRHGAR